MAWCCLWFGLGTKERIPDYFQWVGGPWLHSPSPAEAPGASAASFIELRVEAIPLGGPNAGLAPAASLLQGVQLLLHSCRVLAVVAASGAGGGRIPKVFGNSSMAAPGADSRAEARGEGPWQTLVHPVPKLGTVSGSDRHCAKNGVLISHVSLTGISVATLQMRTVR